MKFIQSRHKVVGIVGAVVAIVIAAVYFFVVPERASGAEGIREVILLYGHSACWLLIATGSILWSVNKNNRWSVRVLYAALVVYVVFLIGIVM